MKTLASEMTALLRQSKKKIIEKVVKSNLINLWNFTATKTSKTSEVRHLPHLGRSRGEQAIKASHREDKVIAGKLRECWGRWIPMQTGTAELVLHLLLQEGTKQQQLLPEGSKSFAPPATGGTRLPCPCILHKEVKEKPETSGVSYPENTCLSWKE